MRETSCVCALLKISSGGVRKNALGTAVDFAPQARREDKRHTQDPEHPMVLMCASCLLGDGRRSGHRNRRDNPLRVEAVFFSASLRLCVKRQRSEIRDSLAAARAKP